MSISPSPHDRLVHLYELHSCFYAICNADSIPDTDHLDFQPIPFFHMSWGDRLKLDAGSEDCRDKDMSFAQFPRFRLFDGSLEPARPCCASVQSCAANACKLCCRLGSNDCPRHGLWEGLTPFWPRSLSTDAVCGEVEPPSRHSHHRAMYDRLLGLVPAVPFFS